MKEKPLLLTLLAPIALPTAAISNQKVLDQSNLYALTFKPKALLNP